MAFIHFMADNPLIGGLVFLLLLVAFVPACMGIYRRRMASAEERRVVTPVESRFLGNQMDKAVLVIGLLLLLALTSWLMKTFS